MGQKNLTNSNSERRNMTPQQLYDEACQHYKQLTLTVRRVGLLLEQADNIRYSTDTALIQIDLILQYMLLSQALKDGEIDNYERQFISMITEHGDLLALINSRFDSDFSWDSLEFLNNKTIFTMLKGVTGDIFDAANDFVTFFAFVDSVLENANYYKSVQTELVAIADCLSWIDGDNSDNSGKELVKIFLGDLYSNKKRNFLESK